MVTKFADRLFRIKAAVCFAAVATALAPRAANAELPADPNATFTFQIENDSTNPYSDQYYTSGLRIGYTSPTDPLPSRFANFGHDLFGQGQQRLSVDLSQLIFTPYYTGNVIPPLYDHPYAGLLLGSSTLITDTDTMRTAFGVGLGVIGPAAFGSQVQNGWHQLAGFYHVQGWSTQIPNQPVIQLTGNRIWRLPAGTVGPLEVDALPELTVAAGTFRIYGQVGGEVRLGQGLNSDFGTSRIRPGLSGTDAYVQALVPVSWYVFFGADGQAVGWDETLDGLPFASSRHVSRLPFVGELEAGFALLIGGCRLTASQVVQTAEFRTQEPGLFQFSSVSISFKF